LADARRTEFGRDFCPVLIALLVRGNRHLAPEGGSVKSRDRLGPTAEPALVDKTTDRPLTTLEFVLVAEPSADDSMH